MHDDRPFDWEKDDGEEEAREEIALENISITIEAMWRIYGEINEWNRGADVKAGIVLATNGAILAGAAVGLSTGTFLAAVQQRHPVYASMLVALTAIVLSSVCAALCLVPPLREGEIESPLFSDYIARHYPTAKAYEDAVRATLADAPSNLAQISHQVWTESRIQRRKLTYATWAIRFLIASLFFSLVTLLLAFV